MAVISSFAAIAKLDPDWLWRSEPMATWLAARGDVAVIGPLLSAPGVAIGASWAGLLFDATIVGWMWWRRSVTAHPPPSRGLRSWTRLRRTDDSWIEAERQRQAMPLEQVGVGQQIDGPPVGHHPPRVDDHRPLA